MNAFLRNISFFVAVTAFSGPVPCQGANLADKHVQKGFQCAACHEKEPPQKDCFIENSQCLVCHGPLEKLKEKYSSLGKKNPHDNHLGEIECTLCHRGHAKSESYCLQCHKNFHMPMN